MRLDLTRAFEDSGEMVFTHYGLSGPVIFRLSNIVIDNWKHGADISLSLNFKPNTDKERLKGHLAGEFEISR